MLDVKLHDIPRTVHAAVRALVRPGVALLTVHALGGAEMLAAAVEAADERAAELGIDVAEGVRDHHSHESSAPGDLDELGLAGGPAENAMRLAALARDARCAGVVCSVAEVRRLESRPSAKSFSRSVPGSVRAAARTAISDASRRRTTRVPPAPTTSSSGARSSKTPIRPQPRKRSSRS